ncbi:MAG: hypothetical protein M3022_19885 [Actinomycetota bacterium]|nr:hypothetical protein [Actinomycetota bacterium]
MSGRGEQLQVTADDQLGRLLGLIATLADTTLRLPCPGREKLGDGTIAASAQHTADNSQRIAGFVQASDRITAGEPNAHGGHRVPRFLKALGHRPPGHAEHGHDTAGTHGNDSTVESVELPALREQLRATRESLKRLAALTDSQLHTIPPDSSSRFCDGQRTLDLVLESLLKHQSHQVGAPPAALA